MENQVVGFYWIGFFANSGSVLQWVIYAAIIIGLYFCCLLIYYARYRKEGKAYTQALSEYQKRRREHTSSLLLITSKNRLWDLVKSE